MSPLLWSRRCHLQCRRIFLDSSPKPAPFRVIKTTDGRVICREIRQLHLFDLTRRLGAVVAVNWAPLPGPEPNSNRTPPTPFHQPSGQATALVASWRPLRPPWCLQIPHRSPDGLASRSCNQAGQSISKHATPGGQIGTIRDLW